MNWFNILKNQIASTKGKTFQLDFNQPMIEEEECKEKLRAVLKQVESINSIEGFDKIIDKKTVQRHRKVFQSKEEREYFKKTEDKLYKHLMCRHQELMRENEIDRGKKMDEIDNMYEMRNQIIYTKTTNNEEQTNE